MANQADDDKDKMLIRDDQLVAVIADEVRGVGPRAMSCMALILLDSSPLRTRSPAFYSPDSVTSMSVRPATT